MALMGRGMILGKPLSTDTPIFTDDFNRANSSSVGNGWVESGAQNHEILNNRLIKITNSNASWSIQGSTTFASNDQYNEIVYHAGADISMILRCDVNNPGTGGTSPDYYEFSWSTASSGTYGIRKFVAGSATSLTSATGVGNLTAGDVLRAEVQGTALRVKKNGSTVLSTTNGDVASGQYHGVRFDAVTGVFDDYEAGTL